MTTKKSNSKYSASMVAAIVAASKAAEAEGEMLNLERATEIAALPEFVAADATARGVVAKIRSMGLDYAKQEKTDKLGQPVERKEETAARIAQMLGVNVSDVSSLAKAEKPTLRLVAARLEELVSLEG